MLEKKLKKKFKNNTSNQHISIENAYKPNTTY